MAIILPVVFVLTLMVVQVVMWYLARETALDAARAGARAAAAYQASPGDGAAAARARLRQTSGDLLRGTAVSASSNGERVQVQVSGTAVSLIPGVGARRFTQTATAEVERWTTPGEG
ncbi:pilus assembly protein [Streptomyces sp. OF1]|uniref:Pilus assembly protein n=1 Tax=Streptomyces alkaliterrae TaxID=2213162 RepID=A0A5P0YJZ2_9ACTN|nr:pilus assembly protein [Streptomyces alkaliterrae]